MDLLYRFEEWRGWLLAGGAVVVIAALVLLSGGGPEPLPRVTPLPIAQAAERTASLPGARLQIDGKIHAPAGKALVVSGSGVYNGETGRSSVTMRGPGGSYEIEQVAEAQPGSFVAYLRSGAYGALPGGAEWVKVDLSDEVDTRSQSLDPVDHLAVLRSSSEYLNLGTDRIRGVETRHVRAIIHLRAEARRLREAGEDRAADNLETLYAATGTKAYEMEAWVGADMQIHRYRLEIACAAMAVPSTRMSITVDLHDFGVTPDIQLPNEGDVFDATDRSHEDLQELSA